MPKEDGFAKFMSGARDRWAGIVSRRVGGDHEEPLPTLVFETHVGFVQKTAKKPWCSTDLEFGLRDLRMFVWHIIGQSMC